MTGVSVCLTASGNRYEGSWRHDKKNGPGKFFYLDKGQVYTGEWVDDIAKCGTLEDSGREMAANPPIYPIPEVCHTTQSTAVSANLYHSFTSCYLPCHSLQCSLEDPESVLDNAREGLDQ